MEQLTTNFVYLFSENSEVIRASLNPKIKLDNPELIKISKDRAVVPITLKVNPARPGCSYISLNVV